MEIVFVFYYVGKNKYRLVKVFFFNFEFLYCLEGLLSIVNEVIEILIMFLDKKKY